jgi:hypothetical protein
VDDVAEHAAWASGAFAHIRSFVPCRDRIAAGRSVTEPGASPGPVSGRDGRYLPAVVCRNTLLAYPPTGIVLWRTPLSRQS